jgi:hypothetical protein
MNVNGKSVIPYNTHAKLQPSADFYNGSLWRHGSHNQRTTSICFLSRVEVTGTDHCLKTADCNSRVLFLLQRCVCIAFFTCPNVRCGLHGPRNMARVASQMGNMSAHFTYLRITAAELTEVTGAVQSDHLLRGTRPTVCNERKVATSTTTMMKI